MIRDIGKKRMTLIGAMLAANVLLGLSAYLYFIPSNAKLERELRLTKSQISQKRSEAERLRGEYDVILREKDRYSDMQKSGFFSMQDRLEARKRIETIQGYSRVISAKYNIMPGVPEKVDAAAETNYVLLTSPMQVTVSALDDVDVYNFMALMEGAFPGHVTIRSFEIERTLDLNDVVLRQIGSGIPTTMITGKMELSWRTLLPEDKLVSSEFPVTP